MPIIVQLAFVFLSENAFSDTRTKIPRVSGRWTAYGRSELPAQPSFTAEAQQ